MHFLIVPLHMPEPGLLKGVEGRGARRGARSATPVTHMSKQDDRPYYKGQSRPQHAVDHHTGRHNCSDGVTQVRWLIEAAVHRTTRTLFFHKCLHSINIHTGRPIAFVI